MVFQKRDQIPRQRLRHAMAHESGLQLYRNDTPERRSTTLQDFQFQSFHIQLHQVWRRNAEFGGRAVHRHRRNMDPALDLEKISRP